MGEGSLVCCCRLEQQPDSEKGHFPAKRSKMMKASARRTSSDTMVWAQEATAKQDSSAHQQRTPHTPQKHGIMKFFSRHPEEVTQSRAPPPPPPPEIMKFLSSKLEEVTQKHGVQAQQTQKNEVRPTGGYGRRTPRSLLCGRIWLWVNTNGTIFWG